MDAGSIIGLVVVLIACVAFALLYEEPTIKGAASTIDELPTQTLLMGSTLWQITILRKSGYLHDVREVLGDADEAISKALTSCRRSGIYSIIITKNEPAILEFYSANQNGRGKAIGGFRIAPANEGAMQVVADSVQARAADIEAQLLETKRILARALLDSIKPGMDEKQKEVLGSLPEDMIISAMADQITGQESGSGEPFTFVIPINFTDSDGTYYENMRLVVSHDMTAS